MSGYDDRQRRHGEHIQPPTAHGYKITWSKYTKPTGRTPRLTSWPTGSYRRIKEERKVEENGILTLDLLLTVCGATYSTALSLSRYCGPQLCVEGVWDSNQCQCVDACPNTFCGPNQIVNKVTCQCQTYCTLSCSSPQILYPLVCRCACPSTWYPFPKYLNLGTCNCDCLRQECPYGMIFDLYTCQCEDLLDTERLWQDPSTPFNTSMYADNGRQQTGVDIRQRSSSLTNSLL